MRNGARSNSPHRCRPECAPEAGNVIRATRSHTSCKAFGQRVLPAKQMCQCVSQEANFAGECVGVIADGKGAFGEVAKFFGKHFIGGVDPRGIDCGGQFPLRV